MREADRGGVEEERAGRPAEREVQGHRSAGGQPADDDRIVPRGERVVRGDRDGHPVFPGRPVHVRRHGPAARKERDVHRVAIRSDRAAQDMELVRHPGESVEQQDCLAARPGDPDVIAQADHRPMVGP